jgi:hypothetical protein
MPLEHPVMTAILGFMAIVLPRAAGVRR